MIIINKDFKFEKDVYNFILYRRYSGKDKKGNLKDHERVTYHGTVQQVYDYILATAFEGCDALEEVIDRQERIKKDILQSLYGDVT